METSVTQEINVPKNKPLKSKLSLLMFISLKLVINVIIKFKKRKHSKRGFVTYSTGSFSIQFGKQVSPTKNVLFQNFILLLNLLLPPLQNALIIYQNNFNVVPLLIHHLILVISFLFSFAILISSLLAFNRGHPRWPFFSWFLFNQLELSGSW